MAPPVPPSLPVSETGAELEGRLRTLEQRVREQLAALDEEEGAVRVEGAEVLHLIACVRELLRDREALLEEVEALECAAEPRRT